MNRRKPQTDARIRYRRFKWDLAFTCVPDPIGDSLDFRIDSGLVIGAQFPNLRLFFDELASQPVQVFGSRF